MNGPTNAPTVLLTVPQVADRLSVSVRKVWRMISQKLLPKVKVGARGTRITDTAVQAYIDSLTAPADR